MIREPEETKSSLELLDTWRDIITSDGWNQFKDLLAAHWEYLEGQVLIAVKTKDFERASDCLSRADECKKILSMVDQRLSELRRGGS